MMKLGKSFCGKTRYSILSGEFDSILVIQRAHGTFQREYSSSYSSVVFHVFLNVYELLQNNALLHN